MWKRLFIVFVGLVVAAGCDSSDTGGGLAVTGLVVTTTQSPEAGDRVCGAPARTSGLITAVPNPYRGLSAYETSRDERILRFINLPNRVRIEIVRAYWAGTGSAVSPGGVVGEVVRVLEKNSPSRSLDWDLRDEAGVLVPSGFYRVFFEVDEDVVAEREDIERPVVFEDIYVIQRIVPFSELDPESGITYRDLNPDWVDPTGCL